MSPELLAFYRAYRDWLAVGAPDRAPFNRMTGLCSGIHDYASNTNIPLDKKMKMLGEMEKQFIDAGLNDLHPFDESIEKYVYDFVKHTNPKRIRWVLEHAK